MIQDISSKARLEVKLMLACTTLGSGIMSQGTCPEDAWDYSHRAAGSTNFISRMLFTGLYLKGGGWRQEMYQFREKALFLDPNYHL